MAGDHLEVTFVRARQTPSSSVRAGAANGAAVDFTEEILMRRELATVLHAALSLAVAAGAGG